jgi:hypothetical protein
MEQESTNQIYQTSGIHRQGGKRLEHFKRIWEMNFVESSLTNHWIDVMNMKNCVWIKFHLTLDHGLASRESTLWIAVWIDWRIN